MALACASCRSTAASSPCGASWPLPTAAPTAQSAMLARWRSEGYTLMQRCRACSSGGKEQVSQLVRAWSLEGDDGRLARVRQQAGGDAVRPARLVCNTASQPAERACPFISRHIKPGPSILRCIQHPPASLQQTLLTPPQTRSTASATWGAQSPPVASAWPAVVCPAGNDSVDHRQGAERQLF